MKKRYVLAIDLGASSGRGMVGCFDGEKIILKEIHRFPNVPITIGNTLHWDIDRLFNDIKQSIAKAALLYPIESVSVDTWGVDFGLLGSDGNLLENPVHYRDNRTVGMLERAKQYLSNEEHYRLSGNQLMEINTAFQLLSLKENRLELLEKADKMLMMPDLFHYLLCKEKCSEQTIASTSQLYDPFKKTWSKEIIEAFDFPSCIFTPVVPPGTLLGRLHKSLADELGVSNLVVMTTAGHDTQSAMIAVPTEQKDFLFLSCGTWSLLGTETSVPIATPKTLSKGMTNESAYGGKTAFLQNITGLWLIQESRRQWALEGRDYNFAKMAKLAQNSQKIDSYINPDDPIFASPGDIPNRVQEYCRNTEQSIPKNDGQILRCIYQSLALRHKLAAETVSDCTGKEYKELHIIGGGANAAPLCQMTADACQKTVLAGPSEATALGNAAAQFIALGCLENLEQARQCIRSSCEPIQYDSISLEE